MKKLLLFTWMMMLSIAAMAQTIIVVDKDGNRVPYDPSKIISVEFQNTPPGFSINMDGMSIPYTFEVVKSIQGNPNFVFVDPETVKVNGEGEDLAVHVKADVEFDATTSDSWITFDTEAKDGMCYVKVAMNPSVDERSATVVLKSKDGTLTSTLNVVQAGKEDSRYIDIDWEKDRLDSFDVRPRDGRGRDYLQGRSSRDGRIRHRDGARRAGHPDDSHHRGSIGCRQDCHPEDNAGRHGQPVPRREVHPRLRHDWQ